MRNFFIHKANKQWTVCPENVQDKLPPLDKMYNIKF